MNGMRETSRKLMLGMALVLFYSTAQAASTIEQAKSYASGLGQQVLDILGEKTTSDNEKQNRLRAMFQQNVDVDWIGKFVLGRNWRMATPQQQQEYLNYYGKFLINNYTSKFKNYTGETFDITHALDNGNGEYVISMEIIRPKEPKVLVDYRVRNTPGGFRIYDIVVEGVSLINTQRSEFSSVVNRKGLDALIEMLAKKVAAQETASS